MSSNKLSYLISILFFFISFFGVCIVVASPLSEASTSLNLGVDQTKGDGIWELKIIDVSLTKKIKTIYGHFEANREHYLYLIELKLINTIDAASILGVDPQQIVVIDSKSKKHKAYGIATVGGLFATDGIKTKIMIEAGLNNPSGTIIVDMLNKDQKKWTIELRNKGAAKLILIFVVDRTALIEELHWLDLTSLKIE